MDQHEVENLRRIVLSVALDVTMPHRWDANPSLNPGLFANQSACSLHDVEIVNPCLTNYKDIVPEIGGPTGGLARRMVV